MKKQISLSYLHDGLAEVRTTKKEFLAQIEQIIPWGEWETIIQPCYYKGERGNKPYGLDIMLHLHIGNDCRFSHHRCSVFHQKQGKEARSGCTLRKKGSTQYFGYKAHVGVDQDTGLLHHIKVTVANIHDVTMVSQLLTGEEAVVYGDSGYLGAEKRKDAVICNTQGRKIRYNTSRRPSQFRNHSVRSQAQIKRREREKSPIRAKVEHIFGVVKCLFGYRKTRYRGLLKQTSKLDIMFALANLYLANKRGLLA